MKVCAPERLKQVQSGNYRSERLHHGIGLRNVRKRLQIIYGGRSDVTVRSEFGKYTTVTITMDHYRSIPKREQGGEVNEDHSQLTTNRWSSSISCSVCAMQAAKMKSPQR